MTDGPDTGMPQSKRKPLGGRSYGSIPHLLGSRRGPTDRGCNEGQHRICCERVRDKRDRVIVTEKLDGSNVAAAKIGGAIVALTRSGYVADTSPYEQHHAWGQWVAARADRFSALLAEGERVCGEWMVQAHGTVYALHHEPFVAFGIRTVKSRAPWDDVVERCRGAGFVTPAVLHDAHAPMSVAAAMAALGDRGHHGAQEPAEGAVWRVERLHKNGRILVDFLAKFVRADKVDGKHFESVTGLPTVWNTWPDEDAPND